MTDHLHLFEERNNYRFRVSGSPYIVIVEPFKLIVFEAKLHCLVIIDLAMLVIALRAFYPLEGKTSKPTLRYLLIVKIWDLRAM